MPLSKPARTVARAGFLQLSQDDSCVIIFCFGILAMSETDRLTQFGTLIIQET